MRVVYHEQGVHAARTRGRIARIGRALVGKFLSDVEAENAEAMLDAERQQLREQVARYNRGLASHAALCARLRKRIEAAEKEASALEGRARRRLEAGNREAAGQAALRREKRVTELGELREQLARSEATYEELVRARESSVTAAREKLESLKHGIGDLKVKRALAELTETAGVLDGSFATDDGHLERLAERIEEERELADGRVRVAQESALLARDEDEDEDQAALADEALARLEGREGD